jgi:hypothetical protein
MSRVISGQAKDMPFQCVSKDMNNPSAYQVKCGCGKPFGSLGQYKPDEAGRRIIQCDSDTPEQNAALVRRMQLVLTPQFIRRDKGCGAYTIIDARGQVLRFIEKGSEVWQSLHDKLDIVRVNKERAQRAELAAEAAADAVRRGGRKVG